MKRRISILAISVAALGCGKEEKPTPETAPAQAALTSSAPTRWVAVRPAQDASLLSAPCIVRAAAHGSGEVSTTFRAQVMTVLVQAGDTVVAGQPIAEVVAPKVVAAAAEYLGLFSRLKVHRERLQALQQLRKEGMVRTSAVFEQKALISELSASLKNATAVLKMAQLLPKDASRILHSNQFVLVSPVAGIVSEINGHPGEVLEQASSIARIVGTASARIEASSPVSLTVGNSLSMIAADGKTYDLVPTPISTLVSPDTGMHKTWFSLLDASTRLGDGQRCTLEWSLSEDVWEAPAAAIVSSESGSVLWRRRDSTVSQVTVQVLKSSGSSVLVQGELIDGDQVAADGNVLVAGEGGTP